MAICKSIDKSVNYIWLENICFICYSIPNLWIVISFLKKYPQYPINTFKDQEAASFVV